MNKFKASKKDLIFEELIKELRPITRKSKRLDYGTSSTAKNSTEHILEFDYMGCEIKVELK